MMSVYVGVAGPDIDIGPCRDSIQNIDRGPDDVIVFGRGTKGYEVRQQHFNNFIASNHEWLLLLDHDMVYAPDTLTRLLAHGVNYVTGYYLQRRYAPMIPVWFHPGDEWPLAPFLDLPKSGRLYELGASGWGCVLLHRTVIEGTRARVLKGQWDVLEDDLDAWPYDLTVVMQALREGDLDTLRREIRPWRGQFDRRPVGSDLRYPMLARAAGFTLWGDPDVRPGHVIEYPLAASDYALQDEATRAAVVQSAAEATARGRAAWAAHMRELGHSDEWGHE